MSADTEGLLAAFASMTLLELSEFIKEFEKRFDVTAATQGPAPAQIELPPTIEEPEQDEFTVILESYGDKKIQVIKEIRALTKLGLAEAKAFVEDAPKTVLEDVSKDEAERAYTALKAAGATVVVR